MNDSVMETEETAQESAESDVSECDEDTQQPDEEACPICFEPWTNSDSHRLVALKCGHLFGLSCIERWLKQQGTRCPQCNTKALRKDIRKIFARTIKTIDTTERDQALKQLQEEKERRREAELDAARERLNYQTLLTECNQLKVKLADYELQLRHCRCRSNRPQGSQSSQSAATDLQHSYVFQKFLKISEVGGCRVMAYNYTAGALYVSQQSAVPFFQDYGVNKINSLDFKSSQYVSIHSKPIRDLSCNLMCTDSLLLSVSVDRTVKLTSLQSNSTVQSYTCDSPMWSCCWNADDLNYFYAGGQNGVVNVFDRRNLREPATFINRDGSRSPVVSLKYFSEKEATDTLFSGLFVGQLDNVCFYERQDDLDYKCHILPFEASLVSLSLFNTPAYLLATYRPSVQHPSIRHQLYSFQHAANENKTTSVCQCSLVRSFIGGPTQRLMSRSILARRDRELLVCGCDETTLSVMVWNAENGEQCQKLSSDEPVIDICHFDVNNDFFLTALTEKGLNVYKYI